MTHRSREEPVKIEPNKPKRLFLTFTEKLFLTDVKQTIQILLGLFYNYLFFALFVVVCLELLSNVWQVPLEELLSTAIILGDAIIVQGEVLIDLEEPVVLQREKKLVLFNRC